jgi:tRNA A-37 threonylcarbamoyl transferase component Bud32
MQSSRGLTSLHLRQGHPDFLDLPWHLPLARWDAASCPRLVEVPRGLSRHTVVFVAYGADIYALKELPTPVGQREYDVLRGLEERHLPAVTAVGVARQRAPGEPDNAVAVLLTQYLASSLPYRTLFMNKGLERYRERLLDAMASLLVRLHLGGFFWGDCSLSNVLFRRDAGELQAYAVDAETSELHAKLSDGQRELDLMILEENVTGGLADLAAMPEAELPSSLDVYETGASIRQRYERLWNEINKEISISAAESYRIHERIRALNELGFSVGEMDLVASGDGSQLRMRTIVTDRDYHRHQLHNLTGVVAEERQAALLLNEIRELKATLTREMNRSVALSVAAFRWLEQRFRPTVSKLHRELGPPADEAELYCQVLEHKWFLSEKAKRDVGLEVALKGYIRLRRKEPAPALLRA